MTITITLAGLVIAIQAVIITAALIACFVLYKKRNATRIPDLGLDRNEVKTVKSDANGVFPYDPATGTKKCNKCMKTKPVSKFYESKANRDGFMGRCKKCNNRINYTSRKNRQSRKSRVAPVESDRVESDRVERIANQVVQLDPIPYEQFDMTDDQVAELFDHLADSGNLAQACREIGLHHNYSNVMYWLKENDLYGRVPEIVDEYLAVNSTRKIKPPSYWTENRFATLLEAVRETGSVARAVKQLGWDSTPGCVNGGITRYGRRAEFDRAILDFKINLCETVIEEVRHVGGIQEACAKLNIDYPTHQSVYAWIRDVVDGIDRLNEAKAEYNMKRFNGNTTEYQLKTNDAPANPRTGKPENWDDELEPQVIDAMSEVGSLQKALNIVCPYISQARAYNWISSKPGGYKKMDEAKQRFNLAKQMEPSKPESIETEPELPDNEAEDWNFPNETTETQSSAQIH